MSAFLVHILLSLVVVMLTIFGEVSAQSAEIDSCNQAILPPKAGLLPVVLPQLDRLEESVAKQIGSLQQSFIDLIAKGEVSDTELVDGFGTLGQLYHAYELTESAESCYLNAISLAPQNYRWLHLLAALYQKSGQLSEAVRYYQLMRQSRPDYVATPSNLGSVYLQLNRLDDARREFQIALQLDPDFAAAHNGLGQVALAERKYSEAVKHFHAALKRVPAANRIHYSLAMAYRGMGDVEKAQAHLSQQGVVGVRPVDPLVDGLKELLKGERVYLIQGRMAISAGRYKEAADAFAKAVDAKPESVRARVNLGVSLAEIGDTDGAIEQFRVAIQYDPKNQNARFNLGIQLFHKKEYAEAIKQFQSLLEVNPKDLEATRELAKVLVRVDRENEALDYLQKASALVPEDEPTLLDLSGLLIQKGHYKEARDLLDEANRRFPDRGLTAHDLARLLAACPDTSLRDGKRALELATKVYRAKSIPMHAETLAMALAELGGCEEAAALQRQLLAMAEQLINDKWVARLKENLVRYEKGSPCRPAVQDGT